ERFSERGAPVEYIILPSGHPWISIKDVRAKFELSLLGGGFGHAFHSFCTVFPRLPFLCDLHQQLSHSGSAAITHAFNKHKATFYTNTSISLGIVIVRQLAPPANVDIVYRNRNEYGCLFEDECTRMDVERVEKFVSSAKMFTKLILTKRFEKSANMRNKIIIVRQLAPPANVDIVYRNRNEYGCLFEDECTRMDVERVEKFVSSAKMFTKIFTVRQLAPPANVDIVYRNRNEYGCLFEDECTRMDVERVEKFVSSAKMFTKIYASTLYERWFAEGSENCNQANVLALIILDGLVNDVRKLPYVRIHTGWPLHMVVADLVEQLGYALREFYALNGGTRVHLIPTWAVQVFALCAVLVIVALLVEWYIVRRKLAVNRSMSAVQLHAGKSKTHLMLTVNVFFVNNSAALREQLDQGLRTGIQTSSTNKLLHITSYARKETQVLLLYSKWHRENV
uniref:Uncharacterized protein n=1 Tax=Ascaris lumbricoides TaxID=6252 RepID=A0A9J2PZC2_ASCLU